MGTISKGYCPILPFKTLFKQFLANGNSREYKMGALAENRIKHLIVLKIG